MVSRDSSTWQKFSKVCPLCEVSFEGLRHRVYCSDKCRLKTREIQRYAEHRAILHAAKNVPCMDCGRSYPPCVMDLDHVRGVKRADAGKMVGRSSSRLLLEEIAKCDVVCSNCHRIRTFTRNGHLAA